MVPPAVIDLVGGLLGDATGTDPETLEAAKRVAKGAFDEADPIAATGRAIGDRVRDAAASLFEQAMQLLWEVSLDMLRLAFGLADRFSVFTVDTREGPVSVLWPLMLWTSLALALGLFFWQVTVTSLRGGRGFFRLVLGPAQYGVALAVTVGLVGVFLVGADGLTRGILDYGLNARNFQDGLKATSFVDGQTDLIKVAALGVCAVVGVIPAALGYILEMLFREAAIYLLVATVPIVAAGLLANVTAHWFWRSVRWMLAAIAMKPVLAMAIVLGVAVAGEAKGLSGLLAGVCVLLVSLFSPLVLFRLFAFVDPNTDAGSGMRGALSSVGIDSYGSHNPAISAGAAAQGALAGSGADVLTEDTNDARHDAAQPETGQGETGSSIPGSEGSDGGGSENGGATATGAQTEDSSAPPPDTEDDTAGDDTTGDDMTGDDTGGFAGDGSDGPGDADHYAGGDLGGGSAVATDPPEPDRGPEPFGSGGGGHDPASGSAGEGDDPAVSR